jgi:RHS repeat-associated protein
MDMPDVSGLNAVISGYTQRNVNRRMSKSYNANSISWYSYDEQGRMEWMVQNLPGLGVKTIHYEYGLRGNLKRTIYQKGTSSERFEHKYEYDVNFRMACVKTRAGQGLLQKEALYKYYMHGPLKRTELAIDLQGIDYLYTVDGMLKGINHPTLDYTKDPGQDNYTGVNSTFAKDVFGLQLQYYDNDYNRTGSNVTNTTLAGYQDQFNGSLKGVKWQIKDYPMSGNMLMYAFAYDQKDQMINADFGTVNAAAENTFTASAAFGIANNYDANGNLTSKLRKDASGNAYDDFVYGYGTTPTNNQLNTLTAGGNVTRNYDYDASGKCIREHLNGNTLRSMTYNSFDLVTEIKEYNSVLGQDVTVAKFAYNEAGQRIKKEIYAAGVLSVTTWYVRDVEGNILSVYDNSYSTMKQTEMPIYGKGRIGEARRNAGTSVDYVYELTDHLGTVRATIKREKTSGQAVLETWSDYYADGEVMPTRNGVLGYQSRFGYQGQFAERDETGLNNFELRMFDTKIGRWISPDPYAQYHSPYMAMGNNPISFVDPDGGDDIKVAPMPSLPGVNVSGAGGLIATPTTSAALLPDVTDGSEGGSGSGGGSGSASGSLFNDMGWGTLNLSGPLPNYSMMYKMKTDKYIAEQQEKTSKILAEMNKANKGDGSVYNASGTQNNTGNVGTASSNGMGNGSFSSYFQQSNNFQGVMADGGPGGGWWPFKTGAYNDTWEGNSDGANQGFTMIGLGLWGVGARGWLLKLFSSGGAKNIAKFSIDPNKFKYFFGKVVTGNAHNIERSAQNLKDLSKMGITSESQLMEVFNKAFDSGKVISTKTSEFGTTVMKSVNIGDKGSIGVGFFYKGGDMTATPTISSIIPKTW